MSLWSRAAGVAARTPASRNRYVDFLRAVSILMVITGHWLVAAPYVIDGQLTLGSMLEYQRWTQLLSWAFQVMPVFFFVGGYSNGVSWKAAVRDGRSYAEWLNGRLQRLAGPVLPLLVVWALLGIAGYLSGVRPEMVKVGSQMALIPIWFLAVYVGVVVLVPLTYAAWQRFGMVSFWVLAVAVAVDDLLFFAADLRSVGWLNYGFIWVAVHQLGYAWRDGKLQTGRKALLWSGAGLAILIVLVTLGPHPLSMVSVPGEEVSNSLPPKLPMLLLGMIQVGLALALEAPARRWLERPHPWTATVLVNGMIMTIFLWHLTASTLIIGLALQIGNVGLTLEPGSGMWWLARPVWLGIYLLALAAFALAFGLFERGGAGGPPAAAWRQIVGAVMICGGLALLALDGIGGEGWLGLRWWVVLLPLLGAVLAGVNPLARSRAREA
ncbi:MAG: acyltransferase family protein [Gemmatimonadales bacterium]|nr:acyltransferase family protein [Gemmatimonadales bacterium]